MNVNTAIGETFTGSMAGCDWSQPAGRDANNGEYGFRPGGARLEREGGQSKVNHKIHMKHGRHRYCY